jgi:hypothetical protein
MSVFAMLNAFWLLPLYATADSEDDTEDRITSLSVANVPAGSNRLIGAAIASYLIFGYAMYSVLGELEWFTMVRNFEEFISRGGFSFI